MKHRVYVKFPDSGLGNLLLIWARAKVFSHLNAFNLVTSRWWGVRWGTWLRNEQRKRLYWGYFYESPLWQRLAIFFLRKRYATVYEPKLEKINAPAEPVIFCFKETVVKNDLFEGLREHRELIKVELVKLLKPHLLRQLETLDTPEIAVHIRRGDFKFGNPITPTTFFLNCICFIRSITNKNLRVTVFSDADANEIKEILDLENVYLADKKPDVLDIIQMSQSRIIVLSQSSTFSYWAAFLSDAIVIKPAGDWQNDLRPSEVNRRKFEGKIAFEQPETLIGLEEALQKEAW